MKPGKDFNSRMPVDILVDVLPDGNPLLDAIAPTASASHTGMTSGYHAITQLEPYLYDSGQMVLMGDLTPGGNSFVSNIIPAGGDLFLFGTSVTSTSKSAIVGLWDPTTRAWTPLDASALDAEAAYYAALVGDGIYFTYGNDVSRGGVGVSYVDLATGQVHDLQLPVSGPAFTTESNNGLLVVTGDFENGADIITYDPAGAPGSEFVVYTLPGTASVWGGVIGSAGDYTYVYAYDSGWNLYSLNVETGAISKSVEDVTFGGTEWQTSFIMANGTLNGDLYLGVINSSGAMEILKADDATGAVTSVYEAPGAFLDLIEETSNALWYVDVISEVDKLVKISGDGTVQTFDTNADFVYSAQELNGTLYVGASVGGVLALYSLDQTSGSLTFVHDLDGAASAETIVGTIDDHLVVSTDSDNNGIWELWTSDSPSDAASWTQISPSDVDVNPVFGYGTILAGDYLV